jgi:hypothetical protein
MAALSTRAGTGRGIGPHDAPPPALAGRPAGIPPATGRETDEAPRGVPPATARRGTRQTPEPGLDGADLYWTYLHCTFDGRR